MEGRHEWGGGGVWVCEANTLSFPYIVLIMHSFWYTQL